MINKPLLKRVLSLCGYLAIVCVVSFLVLNHHSPILSPGDKAPMGERITLFDGRIVALETMLKKPLIVNFWATWCPPCQKELPAFSKLAQKYTGKIQFVGPVIDSPKSEAQALIERLQISYPVGVMSKASIEKWRAQTLPTTYIVDHTGQIIWAKVGAVSSSTLEAAIEKVLSK